jgi:protease-4
MSELRKHERLQLSPAAVLVSTRRQSIRGVCARAIVCSLSLFLTAGCISIDLLGGGAEAELVETVVRGESGPKILLIEIDGVIDGATGRDTLLGLAEYSMVARVREVLDGARHDDEVRALLLRIDSPGGTATASEQIYTEIMRFRKERDVPVVAQFQSTATSGGYYVAMAADTIQAHPTSITGSIGVLFSSVSFAGLMEKLGVEDQTITGGIHKDAGSPYRRLSAVERQQLQAIVDDLHVRFKEIVGRGRPDLSAEKIDGLADGRIFSAPQALDHGLIDRIGTLEDSVVELEARLAIQKSRVVTYHRPREIRRNLYTEMARLPSLGPGSGGELSAEVWALKQLGRILGRPGFHYLWWPGLSTSMLRH